jgi:hypothetical protein
MNSRWKKPEEVYRMVFVLSNLFLILSTVLFLVYLIAPLLGGILYINSLIHYGSWIVVALATRIVSQRGRKGFHIRAPEYILLCLVMIINFAIWFSYPINVVLGILSIVVIAISYGTNRKRMNQAKEA